PWRSSIRPRNGEQAATVIAAIPNAAEMLSRPQPNSPLSDFRKTLNVNTSSEPKLTITPQKAASTTSHPPELLCCAGATLLAGIAMNCRPLAAFTVRFLAQSMHSRGIDPPVVEIE